MSRVYCPCGRYEDVEHACIITHKKLKLERDTLAAACAAAEVDRDNALADMRTLEARVQALEAALDNAGVLSDWINRARTVIADLMLAYERRIRSDCINAEQIAARPWTCGEYIMAERLLADKPKAVVMLTIAPPASETDAAHASYIKTRDCEHDWQEIDAYPFREARCRKCGAGKTLPIGRYSASEPDGAQS